MTILNSRDYKKLFGEALFTASRQLVADAVKSKLEEEGLEPVSFPIDDLVEHLASGSDAPFSIESDIGDADVDITLAFSEEEDESLAADLQHLWERRNEVFQIASERYAEEVVRRLIKDWSEQDSYNAADLYGFRMRLRQRWGKTIDLFRMMIHCAGEVLEDSATALMRSRAKKGRVLREVLLGIQARTLRTSTAIAVLLDHGLADEAYARWRTLHELNVIGTFIADNGEEAAIRYRDHESVDLKKRLKQELGWGAKRIPRNQKRKIQRDYGKALLKYGKEFKVDYAWASPYLKTKKGTNQRPTFAQLEQAVYGVDERVPTYMESSLQVHGGRSGLMGLGSSDVQIALGYSNRGLEIPLMNSALVLAKTTILILESNWRNDPVAMLVFLTIEDEIEAEARRVARRLERDERALRRAETKEEVGRRARRPAV